MEKLLMMTEPVCRFCGTSLVNKLVSLGAAPLSNSYLTGDQLHTMEPNYPLEVYVCGDCFLVQLEEFEPPETIFGNYAYFSSYSDSWLRHVKAYAENSIHRFKLNSNSHVLEIASNDGYLLQYFKEKHIPVLGIEPAINVAETAREKGIPTESVFFGSNTAKQLAAKAGKADLLIGNNVLAHVPDLNDFVGGFKHILKPDGVITMEFPHLMKLIEYTQFDTIYHEHFSYFSLITVEKVFNAHELTIFDVEELPTHGGSLRIYARHKGVDSKPVNKKIEILKQRERDAGYLDIGTYLNFEKQVRKLKREILSFLISAKNQGKVVVGYGAPAKGNTLLNYCGISTDFIDYTVDRNPHKQGFFLPGSRIPIKSPDWIGKTKPDYLMILPWNIKDEIMEQMQHIRQWDGKFVIPVPGVPVL
jgi:2-polyprenyl-3-methyl-5-hydroxy-6-metoxy-1,4-benzoquinol methylase